MLNFQEGHEKLIESKLKEREAYADFYATLSAARDVERQFAAIVSDLSESDVILRIAKLKRVFYKYEQYIYEYRTRIGSEKNLKLAYEAVLDSEVLEA